MPHMFNYCSHCGDPITGREPSKVYSENGEYFFFHHRRPCFLLWKKARLERELQNVNRWLTREDEYYD